MSFAPATVMCEQVAALEEVVPHLPCKDERG
jgi:hypothetical protein